MDKQDLGNKGAGVVGGVIGTVVGLSGGPVTLTGVALSVAGAALGSIVADTLKDMANRVLSHRERVRLDNATAYIADGIEKNIAAGLIVRQDDFFMGDANFSGNGAELLEGVLLKCKAQYQEKKVKLIANLFKNVAFDETVSAETAYQFLNIVDELTYLELCTISYYNRKRIFPEIILINERFHALGEASIDTSSTARSLFHLLQLGMIKDTPGNTIINYSLINPNEIALDERGVILFTLLQLEEIDKVDILMAMGPIKL